MNEYFYFDSYALIEIILGNKNYEPYVGKGIIITKLNVFEVFYSFIKNGDEKTALLALNNLLFSVVDFDANTIQLAARLKLIRKKDNLSMADCIGYVTARKHGISFLTGDKEFKDMPNVEFVK